jgi:hypothetical protein
MRSSDQSPGSLTLLMVLGLALFLGAAIFFVFDILYWLKYASWSATKLSDVFRYYGISEPYFVEWRGLQEFWGYLRDAPLSLLLLVIWFLFTGVAGSLFGSVAQAHGRGGSPGRGRRR